jgi:ubiquinone/menaquinone biosynthesis C-methylase UbiE
MSAIESFPIQEDPFYVEDLEQMSRAHNYRRWQFQMIAPYLSGTVLEVGGGIGNFTPELASLTDQVISLEPNAYCYRRLLEKTSKLTNVKTYNATVEELSEKVNDLRADTVVLMNVLEHIRDDTAVLGTLHRKLKPGGRIVVLVPAGPWAYGDLDKRLGHFRRYSKRSVRALIGGLKLELEQLRYYNFIGVWAWWWNAKKAHRQKQSDAQIRVFDKYVVPCISRIERWIAPPLGQSLLFVAR